MSKKVKRFFKQVIIKSKIDCKDERQLEANKSSTDPVDLHVSMQNEQITKSKHKRSHVLWQLQGKYDTETDMMKIFENRWKFRKLQVGKQYFGCTVSSSCKASKYIYFFFQMEKWLMLN
jgi:hypothetical protein